MLDATIILGRHDRRAVAKSNSRRKTIMKRSQDPELASKKLKKKLKAERRAENLKAPVGDDAESEPKESEELLEPLLDEKEEEQSGNDVISDKTFEQLGVNDILCKVTIAPLVCRARRSRLPVPKSLQHWLILT